jgi:cytochrome P450
MACPVSASMLDPAVQDEPWEFYAELHEKCPVLPIPEIGAVMVTGYDDVRYVLTNPDLFSSNGRGGGAKKGLQVDKAVRYQQILRDRGWGHVETLQRTDPPIHTDYRRRLNRVFTPKRVRAMADHIDDVANELIDNIFATPATAHGIHEAEFVNDFAMPLPGIIIAEQLGLDKGDIHRFKRWADAMLAISMRQLSDEELLEAAKTELEAQHHLAAEFEKRRTEPTDDLISALVHSHGDDDEPLSMHELQNLMHQLVTGGFETTTNALNHGMWLLTRRPDVQDRVRQDRSLLPAFIEEVLRYESPVQGLARRTTRDVELGGVVIPENTMVIVRYGAANRDPRIFERPDDFNLERADNPHIAFGLGAHFCVGAALARQELTSGFDAWLDRTSSIELARPFDGPVHEPSLLLFPMATLPITITP